jgi:FAD/FMN-containing dehydrogenase
MSGGALTESYVVDMTRHMHKVTIDPLAQTATVQMGAYFRDIEDAAKEHGLMFAAYPSSHRICGIGGMIGNNASGEKSLRGGATSDNVISMRVVLATGEVLEVGAKSIAVTNHPYEQAALALAGRFTSALKDASGAVKKAASGYRLEKVISGSEYSLVPLISGAQGTLGIVTEAVLKLVPIPAHVSLLAISAESLEDVSPIITTILAHNPEGIETFDIHTFEKARIHLTESAELFAPYTAPDAKLFILAQFSEDTQEATEEQALACEAALIAQGYFVQAVHDEQAVAAAWDVRRHSFLLMRDYNEKGHKAVPCIEDVIVPLEVLGTFIHELITILERRNLYYGFHGHIGDGSLRIIPVFDTTKGDPVPDIIALMEEVFALVKRLHGNISADHSDGIIRSPFIKDFYGDELYQVFVDIKKLFDPTDLMNPTKKIVATTERIAAYIDRTP